MKSVLVIEKPTNCIDCPIQQNDRSCGVTRTDLFKIDSSKEVLDDCPLKDLPQKQVANEYNFDTYSNGVNIGWNHCIDAITGEEWKQE